MQWACLLDFPGGQYGHISQAFWARSETRAIFSVLSLFSGWREASSLSTGCSELLWGRESVACPSQPLLCQALREITNKYFQGLSLKCTSLKKESAKNAVRVIISKDKRGDKTSLSLILCAILHWPLSVSRSWQRPCWPAGWECGDQPVCLTVLRKASGFDIALTTKGLTFSYNHQQRAHTILSILNETFF